MTTNETTAAETATDSRREAFLVELATAVRPDNLTDAAAEHLARYDAIVTAIAALPSNRRTYNWIRENIGIFQSAGWVFASMENCVSDGLDNVERELGL